jgi:hypothetical protein
MNKTLENLGQKKLRLFKEQVHKFLEITGKKVVSNNVTLPTKGGFCVVTLNRQNALLKSKNFIEIPLDKAFQNALIQPLRGWNDEFVGFSAGRPGLKSEYYFKRVGLGNVK